MGLTKYIKHDFENAEILIKAAINNALSALEEEKIDSFSFPDYLSYFYIKELMIQRNWNCDFSPLFKFNNKEYFLENFQTLKLVK